MSVLHCFRGDYKQLFKTDNEQCDEMIFSEQNIGIKDYGSKNTILVRFTCFFWFLLE